MKNEKLLKNLKMIYANQKEKRNEAKRNRICFQFFRTSLMGTNNVENFMLKKSRSVVPYTMTVLKYFGTVTEKEIQWCLFLVN